jgi:hypothetical protein
MIARRVLASGTPLAVAMAMTVGACSPTVKLQAPDEPIRFDVNVNITEQKRLEIDQELLALIRQNPALFGLEPADLPDSSPDSEAQQ